MAEKSVFNPEKNKALFHWLMSKYEQHHTLRYHGTFNNDRQLWKESINSDGLWRDRHKHVAGLNELCSFQTCFCEKESPYIYDSLTPFYHLPTFHRMYSCHSTLIHTDSEPVFGLICPCLEELISQSSTLKAYTQTNTPP